MTTVAIDTLATMRKLEKAGFKTEQAEAVAETVAKVVANQSGELATKADLGAVEKSLRREIAGLRWMFGLHFAFTLVVLGFVYQGNQQANQQGQQINQQINQLTQQVAHLSGVVESQKQP